MIYLQYFTFPDADTETDFLWRIKARAMIRFTRLRYYLRIGLNALTSSKSLFYTAETVRGNRQR